MLHPSLKWAKKERKILSKINRLQRKMIKLMEKSQMGYGIPLIGSIPYKLIVKPYYEENDVPKEPPSVPIEPPTPKPTPSPKPPQNAYWFIYIFIK